MSPQAADIDCLLVAAILPIPLVLRWNLLGVALGTLVVWSTLIVAGWLLPSLDLRREGGMLDAVWLLFGWVGGLSYSLLIYLAKGLVIWIRRAAGPLTNAARV